MRSKKKRRPKLTRLEKMTKGLMLSREDIKSKFSVREVEDKGRALFLASRIIRKDSFVLEYEGDVITHDEAEFREKIYETNDEGCYILFFRFQERRLAIDATRRFDSYARYLNHSREPNIRFHPPLLLDLTGRGVPRIPAYALRDIYEGEEIVFDYGIKDGKISWLRNRKRCHESELTDSSSDEDSSSSDDDSEASKKDQIMSITRTPKQNLTLKPSKYLSPVKLQSLNSKPPSLTIPRDGYGIRYIAYPSRPGLKKCYIASMEGLGQPLKIMRSVEERTSTARGAGLKSSQSVISLSESDDSSMKSPTNLTPSEYLPGSTNSCLPVNSAPSSSSKVIEWQQKIKTSPVKQKDTVSDIKILHVRSLIDEKESPAASPSSTLYSVRNNHILQRDSVNPVSTMPFISEGEVMNDSSVPKSFFPSMHPNISNNCPGRIRMSAHHIPSNSIEPTTSNSFKFLPKKLHYDIHRPSTQAYAPSNIHTNNDDNINCDQIKKSPCRAIRSPVKQNSDIRPNVLHEQTDANEMICLSDSDDDDNLQPPICEDKINQSQISAVSFHNSSMKNQSSYHNSKHMFKVEYSSKRQNVQNKQELKCNVDDIVISNVESLNPVVHNVCQRNGVHTVFQHNINRFQGERSDHNWDSQTPGLCQSEKFQCEYQIRNPIRVQSEFQNKGDRNCSKVLNSNIQNAFQEKEILSDFQNSNNKNEHLNHKMKDLYQKSPVNIETTKDDVVEIVDDEESDFEIVSDGEMTPSSPAKSNSLHSKTFSQKHEAFSSIQNKPSCSRTLTVPSDHDSHHRPNPHIAIVKPYSKENDQKIVSKENTAGENVERQSQERKPSEDDVIEVVEENSSDDDGIILTDYKPVRKHEGCILTQSEIETMKEIFQPLILSSDSLSSTCVENAISENFAFFSVLIGRGVPVNEIRRTVWKLFKASGKETDMPS